MFRSMFSTFARIVVVLLVAAVVVGAASAFSSTVAGASPFSVWGDQAPAAGMVHAVNLRGFDGGDDAGRGGSLAGMLDVAKNIFVLSAIIAAVWLFRKVRQPQRVEAAPGGGAGG